MKKQFISIAVIAVVAITAGCAPRTRNIDMVNDPGHAVLELDYRDFNRAATEMIESMVASGALRKPDGGRYVVTTGRIINDTMQRIDTDQLMAKIEEELLNSGLVVMTSAVGGKGATDSMIGEMRNIRDSHEAREFRQETLTGEGELIAPELSIAGKILQRNISYDRRTQQVEYYFQLQVTDLRTGLRFWQREEVIGKRGSSKAAPW